MPSTMFDFQPGQAELMARGLASAVGGGEGLSSTQAGLLDAFGRYVSN
jgi:hypothetical protein